MPSSRISVAFAMPRITGIPRFRPTTAAWLVIPPCSVITAASFLKSRHIIFVCRDRNQNGAFSRFRDCFLRCTRYNDFTDSRLAADALSLCQKLTDVVNFDKVCRAGAANRNASCNNDCVAQAEEACAHAAFYSIFKHFVRRIRIWTQHSE